MKFFVLFIILRCSRSRWIYKYLLLLLHQNSGTSSKNLNPLVSMHTLYWTNMVSRSRCGGGQCPTADIWGNLHPGHMGTGLKVITVLCQPINAHPFDVLMKILDNFHQETIKSICLEIILFCWHLLFLQGTNQSFESF